MKRAATGVTTSVVVAYAFAWASDAATIATTDSTPPPRRVYGVQDSPGYFPPADPESASVRLGRREAKKIAMTLTGGRRSLQALAQAIVAGMSARSDDSLFALNVTQDEFSRILWPEFPQSRPATGWSAEDAWMVLGPRLRSGTRSAWLDAEGHRYRLQRVESRPPTTYTNFRLHDGIVLVVLDEHDRTMRLNWVRSIVERKGVFKIYSVDD